MSYIKLAKAPTLTIRMPDCGACGIEVDSDGDGWICRCCGTTWSYEAGEDTKGTLYEDWAGEPAEGPEVDNDEAWRNGMKHQADELAATLARGIHARKAAKQ